MQHRRGECGAHINFDSPVALETSLNKSSVRSDIHFRSTQTKEGQDYRKRLFGREIVKVSGDNWRFS